jgi:hypothetical protein
MEASTQPSDEELMRELAAGSQEALGPLYRRYAPLISRLAARSPSMLRHRSCRTFSDDLARSRHLI